MAIDRKHGRCSIHASITGYDESHGHLLVDLSDTSTWPHTLATGHVEIESIHIEIDPSSDYRGYIHLGFLADVRGNVADLHVLFCWQFDTGGGRVYESLYFYEHPIVCDTRYHYGRMISDRECFGSDKALCGPTATGVHYAGVGDLVADITRTAGSVSCTFTIGYNIVQETN